MAGRAGRLKVFEAQFGFYDSVVAATSQAAALRAWGTHQNLFADGQARIATDEAAVAAALSHPEVPLRRALGSSGAFELEPSTRPSVPDLPKGAPKRPVAKAAPAARHKPRPDRTSLDAAERAVADLDAARKREERELDARRAELDAEIVAARQTYLERRKAAKATLTAARDAYRKAGGDA